MNPALAVKNPPPAVWRWSVLVAISVAMFGNYYVYDSIAPVADLLQKLLGFTDTQIGTLNAHLQPAEHRRRADRRRHRRSVRDASRPR